MGIRVNILYSWTGSWDWNHNTKNNYEAQFLIILMLNDDIDKRKSI
jgi:hypothetical protein